MSLSHSVREGADASRSETPSLTFLQRFQRFIVELCRQPAAAFGTIVFLVFMLLAAFGPVVAPYEANQQIVEDARQAPGGDHWFGVDHLGRDVFSRVILGARDILSLAGVGTVLSVGVGTLIGLFSGYHGRWVDETMMRVFDSILALPPLLLSLLLLGAVGPSRQSVLLVILVVYTPIVARVVRSVVLGVKSKGYVEAARTRGESDRYILLREILPAVYPALAVEAALRFSYAIFLTSSLGFLGVGVQPPSPDWGLMVKEARRTFALAPWAMYFPAAAISIVVIGVNLMADGLKRVLQQGGR